MSVKNSKSVSYAYLGVLIPAILAFYLFPIVLENLGPERFGVLSLIISISAFFSLFDFGIGIATSRFVARLLHKTNGGVRSSELIKLSLLLSVLFGVLVALMLLIYHYSFGLVVSDSIKSNEIDGAIFMVAMSIPLAMLGGVVRNAFEGLNVFLLANILRILQTSLVFLSPIIVSTYTQNLELIALSILILRIIVVAVFLFLLKTHIEIFFIERSFLKNINKKIKILIHYGAWTSVGTLFGGVIVLGVLDRMIISQYMGAEYIIHYSVSSDIAIRMLLIPAALTSVIMPYMSTLHSQGKLLNSSAQYGANLIYYQLTPLLVLLTLNAQAVFDILSPEYQISVNGFYIIIIGVFFNALAHIPFSVLHALGRPDIASKRHIIEFPVYLAIILFIVQFKNTLYISTLWTLWTFIDFILIIYLLKNIYSEFDFFSQNSFKIVMSLLALFISIYISFNEYSFFSAIISLAVIPIWIVSLFNFYNSNDNIK
jgi:O-antigen/teichoic acid export membrane protein